MNILLVANSAREHAIAEALARSRHKPKITAVCKTRNPGILAHAEAMHVHDIMDFPAIVAIAEETKPDFAVIGPDDPIGAGLADELEAIGVPCVAPRKILAQIESSKGFARELVKKYGIDASPMFRVFEDTDAKAIRTFIEQELDGNYVVKYDALKGGKGVKVSGEHLQSIDEGVAYAVECIKECGRVVIEEKLVGVEFSLMSFVSGTQVVDMPAVQDHKRAFEGDTGPNTGGMGTYTDASHSLPFLEPSDLARAKEINRQVAEALLKECGEPYRGILYGGFMAVQDGIRLIEFNARFGDPEALNVLPILTSDFVDICSAILEGSLRDDIVQFARCATVCKYVTPKSYPVGKDERGKQVTFPRMPKNARIYYGDVNAEENGTLMLGGSRTAGIVGIAPTIADAEKIAQELCEKVEGSVRFRSDIGRAALIEKRREIVRRSRSSVGE